MTMYMHTVKVEAWRNVCFLPLRRSKPESHRQDSRAHMNATQQMRVGTLDRDSKLRRVIEFLAGEKADIVLLQEAD